MKMRLLYRVGLLFTLLTQLQSQAQITLSGTSYSQNFDNLASGLPTGFTIRTGATATALGTEQILTTTATPWNSTTGQFSNFASADGLTAAATATEQAASTDRALGVRQTGSFGDPGAAIVMQLANTNGFTGFGLQFKLLSLDAASPRTTTWIVEYALGANPTSFTTVGTNYTTLATGGSQFTGTDVIVNFGSLISYQNQPVWIRISTLSASTGSGSRATTAIDDLQLSYAAGSSDVTPPAATSFTPRSGVTNHPANQKLEIIFNEYVLKGTGNIVIKNLTDATSQTIDVKSGDVVNSFNSTEINASLTGGKQYSVIIPAGVFTDLSGNPFAGVAEGSWLFSAIQPDVTPPALTSTIPANNATGLPTSFSMTMYFSENVINDLNGVIRIKKLSDNSIVKSNVFYITGTNRASWSVSGLEMNTSYYVEVSNNAIQDEAGNYFPGFSGPDTWQFKTAGVTSYSYDFNNCTPFGAAGSGWTQYSAAGDSVWSCSPYGNGSNGVQINGYVSGSGPAVNEDWLISPALDLTSFNHPILSFRERTKFSGPALQVYVSTNYSGTGDPAAATWTLLNAVLPAANSDSWTLVDKIDLYAYKRENTYLAFKYTSSPSAGAARITLDDIALRNDPWAPDPSLVTTPGLINIDYVAAGTASAPYPFQFNLLNPYAGTSLTITAPAGFQLSRDNTTFGPAVTYDAAELSGPVTAYVRYQSATANATAGGKLSFATAGIAASEIELVANSYAHEHTLEVVNWNIEWFGGTQAPDNDDLQQANVKTVMERLSADVYALGEIVDTVRLANLAASLPGYAYTVSDYASGAPTSSSAEYAGAQKLAFLYKTSVITNIKARGLLKTSPAAPGNWANGRLPYLLETDVVNGNGSARYHFILVHAKAGNTAADYQRRKEAAQELKDTLDAQFSTARVILLGDFNDDLDATISTGITPPLTSYDDIVKDSTDTDRYTSITLPLSVAGQQSTATNADVVDHVIISDEVAPQYISQSARLITDVTEWVTDYSNTTSDHYPVMSRFLLPSNTTGFKPIAPAALGLAILPNPVGSTLTFSLHPQAGRLGWQVLDGGGKVLIQAAPTRAGNSPLVKAVNVSTLASGVYFLRVVNNNSTTTLKFVKQ